VRSHITRERPQAHTPSSKLGTVSPRTAATPGSAPRRSHPGNEDVHITHSLAAPTESCFPGPNRDGEGSAACQDDSPTHSPWRLRVERLTGENERLLQALSDSRQQLLLVSERLESQGVWDPLGQAVQGQLMALLTDKSRLARENAELRRQVGALQV